MERLDLTEYMVNEDKPNGDETCGWGAGQQLDALRFYMDAARVRILATHQDDDYQGDCYAVMKIGDRFIIWRDSFGSCSGCDGLEDENGFEYIKDTLQEGNTRQFLKPEGAFAYIASTEDYLWTGFPAALFDEARAVHD